MQVHAGGGFAEGHDELPQVASEGESVDEEAAALEGAAQCPICMEEGGCIPCFPALLDARLPFTWLVSGTAVMLPSDLFVFGVVRAILGEIRINITATGWTWVGLE